MNWTNQITTKFKIKYPIIQAPMFGVTTPEMVAASANVGCLGSLALGDLNNEDCVKQIRLTKKLTNCPFASNIFVHKIPEVNPYLIKRYNEAKLFIEQIAKENMLIVKLPDFNTLKIHTYEEQIDALLSENCKIISFTFGNLDFKSIETLKSNGVVLIGTCTTLEEAKILENTDIDMVCVQGIEAGGHRGSFDDDAYSRIGGMSLLSEVKKYLKVPIVYAGGIFDSKTLLASKILGADGFQVGSLLLGSKESKLEEFEKNKLKTISQNNLVLTKSFSGRYARGISNKFIKIMEKSNHILPYPYQNKLTGALRAVSKENKNTEFSSIWAGQFINDFKQDSVTNILQSLIQDVNDFNS